MQYIPTNTRTLFLIIKSASTLSLCAEPLKFTLNYPEGGPIKPIVVGVARVEGSITSIIDISLQ